MSIATVRPPTAIYREEQWFAWWIYALVTAMVTLAILLLVWFRPFANPNAELHNGWAWSLEVPIALLIGLSVPPILIVGVLKMTTEVTPGELLVWFGMVPTYQQAFALEAIRSVEVITYRPWRDSLGWGVRRLRDGTRVLSARGDRGVLLVFNNGSRLIVGSQQPEELARVIDQAVRELA